MIHIEYEPYEGKYFDIWFIDADGNYLHKYCSRTGHMSNTYYKSDVYVSSKIIEYIKDLNLKIKHYS